MRLYTRHDPRFYDKRLYIGGSSKSSNTSTSSQTYYDQRQAIQNDQHNVDYNSTSNWSNATSYNDSHAVSDTGNTTNSGNTSNSGNSFAQWLSSVTSSVADSGNTSVTDSRSSSSSVSDTGNTSSSWTSSLSNSGNSSNATSYSSSTTNQNTDARNLSSQVSNSGNSSTVVNWTGTDQGAVQLEQMQAQLLGAVSGSNVDALKSLALFGSSAIGSANELAAQSSANAMAASSHMLDLTGELIDRLATGTSSAVAAQAAISGAGAQQASASINAAGMQKTALILGGVLLAAIVLKNIKA